MLQYHPLMQLHKMEIMFHYFHNNQIDEVRNHQKIFAILWHIIRNILRGIQKHLTIMDFLLRICYQN